MEPTLMEVLRVLEYVTLDERNTQKARQLTEDLLMRIYKFDGLKAEENV